MKTSWKWLIFAFATPLFLSSCHMTQNKENEEKKYLRNSELFIQIPENQNDLNDEIKKQIIFLKDIHKLVEKIMYTFTFKRRDVFFNEFKTIYSYRKTKIHKFKSELWFSLCFWSVC
ncbi:hypothetical protein [Mycoplasma nasistruthionis]|uniref:Lipoprotein n=1 Tax=Mycoplasma nasistruthionis TaxID=353852 RepID=A0A5B7XW21_9MOLU|nr:hypothetical protein [Mycoplasma nasistruthionis]QCZ36927.1 hypothetical protein FG904_02855 [Mycoplasma nasistruthionis]